MGTYAAADMFLLEEIVPALLPAAACCFRIDARWFAEMVWCGQVVWAVARYRMYSEEL